MDNPYAPPPDPNDMLWKAKLAFIGFWTFILGAGMVMVALGIASVPSDPTVDPGVELAATGCALVMTGGCLGSVWIVGLLAIMLLFTALRR